MKIPSITIAIMILTLVGCKNVTRENVNDTQHHFCVKLDRRFVRKAIEKDKSEPIISDDQPEVIQAILLPFEMARIIHTSSTRVRCEVYEISTNGEGQEAYNQISKHNLKWDYNYIALANNLKGKEWILKIICIGSYNGAVEFRVKRDTTMIVLKNEEYTDCAQQDNAPARATRGR